MIKRTSEQYVGYWWINPNRKVRGTVSLAVDAIMISLERGLIDSQPDPYKTETLQGVLVEGPPCTLFDLELVDSSLGMHGTKAVVYRARSCLWHGSAQSKGSTEFSELRISCREFTRWTLHSAVPRVSLVRLEAGGTRPLCMTWVLDVREIASIDIAAAKLRFQFAAELENSPEGQADHVEFDLVHSVKITAPSKSLSDWTDVLVRMRDLFRMLLGREVAIERVTLTGGNGAKGAKEMIYLMPGVTSFPDRRPPFGFFLIEFPKVVPYLGYVLERWFAVTAGILQSVRQFMSGSFGRDIPPEGSFMLTVQALEMLHREIHAGKLCEASHFKAVRNSISRAISANEAPELNRSICNRLRYADQPDLRSRLHDCMTRLGADAKTAHGLENEFVGMVVDFRNFVIHGAKPRLAATPPEEIRLLTERLKVIYYSEALEWLGIPRSLVDESLADAEYFETMPLED